MTQYVVIRRDSLSELEKGVEYFLTTGYLPVGGVGWDGVCYLQAVGR